MEIIKSALEDLMRRRFEINHSTLEFDFCGRGAECVDQAAVVQYR
jgi:hypothetical protein